MELELPNRLQISSREYLKDIGQNKAQLQEKISIQTDKHINF
jgi:hypothetical protein